MPESARTYVINDNFGRNLQNIASRAHLRDLLGLHTCLINRIYKCINHLYCIIHMWLNLSECLKYILPNQDDNKSGLHAGWPIKKHLKAIPLKL